MPAGWAVVSDRGADRHCLKADALRAAAELLAAADVQDDADRAWALSLQPEGSLAAVRFGLCSVVPSRCDWTLELVSGDAECLSDPDGPGVVVEGRLVGGFGSPVWAERALSSAGVVWRRLPEAA